MGAYGDDLTVVDEQQFVHLLDGGYAVGDENGGHARALTPQIFQNGFFRFYVNGGNGFTFASCNAYDMLYVIHEALEVYKNRAEWEALMKKAATTDFSWDRSAEDYKKLYEETFATLK
jgi:starch synthase